MTSIGEIGKNAYNFFQWHRLYVAKNSITDDRDKIQKNFVMDSKVSFINNYIDIWGKSLNILTNHAEHNRTI